jgi:hypothetical protein
MASTTTSRSEFIQGKGKSWYPRGRWFRPAELVFRLDVLEA